MTRSRLPEKRHHLRFCVSLMGRFRSYLLAGVGKRHRRDLRYFDGGYGSRAAIVCIGPAGERMVRLANIMSEGLHARAAGRSGMGAVMGAKRLKAVVADGNFRTTIARPKELLQSIRDITPNFVEKMKRYRAYGTPGGTVGSAVIADLSAYNWSDGDCGRTVEGLSGEIMMQEHGAGKYHCPPCAIGCGKEVRIRKGHYAGKTAPLEYETIGGFGPQCGVFDWDTIIEANNLCNRLGMDTISVSGAVAFVFEAVSKGIVKSPPHGTGARMGQRRGGLVIDPGDRFRRRCRGDDAGRSSSCRAAAWSGGGKIRRPCERFGSRPTMIPGRSRAWPSAYATQTAERATGVLLTPWSAMDWPASAIHSSWTAWRRKARESSPRSPKTMRRWLTV